MQKICSSEKKLPMHENLKWKMVFTTTFQEQYLVELHLQIFKDAI